MADYPSSLWSGNTRGTNLSDAETHSTWHDDAQDELIAVQTELGTNPSGSSATVAARLDLHFNQICIATASAMTIPTGVASFTEVLFGTDILDPNSWHSTASQTNRITPGVAGYYEVQCNVTLTNNLSAGDRVAVAVLVNGTGVSQCRTDIAAASASILVPTVPVSGVVQLDSDDYISIGVLHSNGSGRNVDARVSVKRVHG